MFHREVTHLKQTVVRIRPTCESQITVIIGNTKLEYSRIVTKRQDEHRRNVKKEKQKIKRKEKYHSTN